MLIFLCETAFELNSSLFGMEDEKKSSDESEKQYFDASFQCESGKRKTKT